MYYFFKSAAKVRIFPELSYRNVYFFSFYHFTDNRNTIVNSKKEPHHCDSPFINILSITICLFSIFHFLAVQQFLDNLLDDGLILGYELVGLWVHLRVAAVALLEDLDCLGAELGHLTGVMYGQKHKFAKNGERGLKSVATNHKKLRQIGGIAAKSVANYSGKDYAEK